MRGVLSFITGQQVLVGRCLSAGPHAQPLYPFLSLRCWDISIPKTRRQKPTHRQVASRAELGLNSGQLDAGPNVYPLPAPRCWLDKTVWTIPFFSGVPSAGSACGVTWTMYSATEGPSWTPLRKRVCARVTGQSSAGARDPGVCADLGPISEM